ncbi:060L [Cherax quadricarinatus iridovirus]|uniref:Uncharacterized protein n=1 Tax=Shrimp hemocyte iridescent virus TaxID=2039780 RepID=A0A291B0U0_9VIRU|nr:060L [Cherax quadricarinatus iridovirus]YP_010084843.1 hypothetical protein KM509_gp091 [Shrimp hemocyte iridescent virus]UPA43378.1 hypothetical protein 4TH000104 [Iridovirus CN01]ASZ85040.1 060L [Cherax quadricarinatus iridovirus]ATE87100.1 hypothetical protein [Shrimp hemocyte iridescent virus]UPA43454.1 hypothetical protein 3TG000021 [Iridovirus CN01]UPA43648.1 hypothetical protein 1DG000056 [Iridovirus CN01]
MASFDDLLSLIKNLNVNVSLGEAKFSTSTPKKEEEKIAVPGVTSVSPSGVRTPSVMMVTKSEMTQSEPAPSLSELLMPKLTPTVAATLTSAYSNMKRETIVDLINQLDQVSKTLQKLNYEIWQTEQNDLFFMLKNFDDIIAFFKVLVNVQ